jgi:hypothetical protein
MNYFDIQLTEFQKGILVTEEFYSSYWNPRIVRVTNQEVGRVCGVNRWRDTKFWIGNCREERRFLRPTRRPEDKTIMDLIDIGCQKAEELNI